MSQHAFSAPRSDAAAGDVPWNSLDPDLLCVVAKHGDAAGLAGLSQTCKAWRNAAASNSAQIWEALLNKRFPRSVDILRALPPSPGFSHLDYYRWQLANEAAEPDRKQAATTCALSDFIFTLELVTLEARTVVASWSGPLEMELTGRTVPGGYPPETSEKIPCHRFRVPLDWTAWEHGLWDATRLYFEEKAARFPQSAHMQVPPILRQLSHLFSSDPIHMRLEIFVSRIAGGRPQTVKIFASDSRYEDFDRAELTGWFYDKELAISRPFEDEYADRPLLDVELLRDETVTGQPYVNFVFSMYHPDADVFPMKEDQILSYLENGAPWQ